MYLVQRDIQKIPRKKQIRPKTIDCGSPYSNTLCYTLMFVQKSIFTPPKRSGHDVDFVNESSALQLGYVRKQEMDRFQPRGVTTGGEAVQNDSL